MLQNSINNTFKKLRTVFLDLLVIGGHYELHVDSVSRYWVLKDLFTLSCALR